jgi:hypothetical protein
MKIVAALRIPHKKRLKGTITILFKKSSLLGFIEDKLLTTPNPIDN